MLKDKEQKEKQRRDLIKEHVRNIEEASYVSLRFQEWLIENDRALSDEVKEYVHNFLTPEDLEEISVERAEAGRCGWIQCKRRIQRDLPKGHWKLDKEQGGIIDTQTLCLFCSTKCYYSFVDLGLRLTESPPHTRVRVLSAVKEWLKSENVIFDEGKPDTSESRDVELKPSGAGANGREVNFTVHPKEQDNGDVSADNGKSSGSSLAESSLDKKRSDLIHLLDGLKTFKKSECGKKESECIKKFEYLSISDDDDYTFKDPAEVLMMDAKCLARGKKKASEEVEFGKANSVGDGREKEECEDKEEECGDEEEYEEDEYEDEEYGEDSALLMSQFYNNLSPEVVVYDLFTSLITRETKLLLSNKVGDDLGRDKGKEEGSIETMKFNMIQNERREVLKDNVSLYINSVEWIGYVSKLSFNIYKILDTFAFPFPIPNFKQGCIELFTFIIIDTIIEKKIDNLNINSLEEDLRCKSRNWIQSISCKYDNRFIQNTKLLFEE